MITKHEAHAVVKKWLKTLFRQMNLTDQNIKIHIYKSNSKFLIKKGVKLEDDMGVCYASDLGADIILFYDKHKNTQEFLGTLIHELLHARIYKLSGLITLRSDLATEIEEDLVRDLEEFIMSMYRKYYKDQ